MNFFKLLFLFVLIGYSANILGEDKVLRLVYKDIGKPPYIEEAPDNSGLYYDLMSLAARKIGFKIEVLRLPKKRSYLLLQSGKADLYASAEFREYRSEFLLYFPNGLYRKERFYGVTKGDIPKIESLSDINTYKLKWVVEMGSSYSHMADSLGINYLETSDTRIEKIVQFLQLGRPFFFHVIIEDVETYLEENNLSSLDELGIRVHRIKALDKQAQLYTCFSRFSPHYKEEPNPDYDTSRPISAENFPTRAVPGSVVDQFRNALQELIDMGKIEQMIRDYNLDE